MKTTNPTLILAPMRGITTRFYRQAFVRHFNGLDLEIAPFISTVRSERINPKLLKDVFPENSSGIPLIPQLIGNNGPDFVHMCKALHDLGYNEINWNLGCPHKPIRKKRRGSGLLPHPEMVDELLEQIHTNNPCHISVKVRLGVTNSTELLHLIPILNKYPLTEVIIHPRTAEQMYKGTVDLDAFSEAYQAIAPPVCYNGDIKTLAFFKQVQTRFPAIDRFMIGRGLLENPFLCEEIKNQKKDAQSPIQRIAAFHEDLLASYEAFLDGDTPVLGKMKEFWTYQATNLSNGYDLFKKLKKAQRLHSYKSIVNEFLEKADWTTI